MPARRSIPGSELEALFKRRQASAEAAVKGHAHRALPLAEVERQAQAERKPWPAHSCTSACHTAICDCSPTTGASACSEFLADPPRPKPPAYPWRDLGAGLLVLLFAVSCVHVIATATQPVQKVAKR